ncbi:MAG: DNA replication/repair protein RecF [Saprospiraceae bacterium]
MPQAPSLQELSVAHFRNLEDATFSFGDGIHLIGGANGMGKTNLLDAIYYLCLTRSHFRYGDAATVKHDEKWLRVAGRFAIGTKTERIALKMQPRKGKTVERNGSAYDSLVEHIGLLPAVMISPADIELAIGGPDERRRFLDQTISQYDPAYLKALMSYNRLLKLRNAMLKSTEHPLELDLTLLHTYDVQLEGPATLIFERRKAFIADLKTYFELLYKAISGDREVAGVTYISKLKERPYSELMMRYRDQDVLMRRTNAGPHRDEIELLINEQNLRRFASQGQLKTAVLALRLAQARVLKAHNEKVPILLLDDLFDRLDPSRVQHLIDLISAEGYAQVFVTDTHPERLKALEVHSLKAHYYLVADGVVTEDPH